MKIVVAMDSFKGSLSSKEAGNAVKKGILEVFPEAEIHVCPLADGGEGSAEALTEALDGSFRNVEVTSLTGRKVNARYGILHGENHKKTAIIEMAEAAGLTLVEGKNDILTATTFGVGEMIMDAINQGVRDFILCIGGSGTNDVGTGMLEALGFEFRVKDGFKGEASQERVSGVKGDYCQEKRRGANALPQISEIDISGVDSRIKECKFRVACDVTNPLYGEKGCSRVFAPQKGASPEQVEMMDEWIRGFAEVCRRTFPNANENAEGAGAAGGMGYALKTFLNAELIPGADLICEATEIEKKIQNADLVITGEGKIDDQTEMGKGPAKVAEIANLYGKPAIAFGGKVSISPEKQRQIGFKECIEILPAGMSLEEGMKKENAVRNLREKVEEVVGDFGPKT